MRLRFESILLVCLLAYMLEASNPGTLFLLTLAVNLWILSYFIVLVLLVYETYRLLRWWHGNEGQIRSVGYMKGLMLNRINFFFFFQKTEGSRERDTEREIHTSCVYLYYSFLKRRTYSHIFSSFETLNKYTGAFLPSWHYPSLHFCPNLKTDFLHSSRFTASWL